MWNEVEPSKLLRSPTLKRCVTPGMGMNLMSGKAAWMKSWVGKVQTVNLTYTVIPNVNY